MRAEAATVVRREDRAGVENGAWSKRESDYRVVEDRLGGVCVGCKAGWDEIWGTLGRGLHGEESLVECYSVHEECCTAA